MKKLIATVLAMVMAVSLSACGTKGEEGNTPTVDGTDATIQNIMFVVTGSLGGGTNNDDVYAAISDYVATVDGNVSTFECNMDTSLYESTLMQAAEMGEYDLIVTCFGTMVEPVENTAAKYPEQKFMIFDTAMDYEGGKNANVISVQVLQNEGGFLAGAMAALLTGSDAARINAEKAVGFVGAIESTAILDFLMGYIDGVNYVDPSIEVLYSFIGNHTDSALAKELGLTQYQQGADVVFACGSNGLGVAEAAQEANGYVIGVDFDYAERLAATSADSAAGVLTSVIKDYRGMVYPVLVSANEGTIAWGTHSYISYGDGGVYLSERNYTEVLPEDIMAQYNEIVAELVAGNITVSTAFGASTAEIEAVKAQAAAQ